MIISTLICYQRINPSPLKDIKILEVKNLKCKLFMK